MPMKTAILLLLLLSFTACQSETLRDDQIVKVPAASRELLKGTVLQPSDIYFQQIAKSDAPPNIPHSLVGHKTRMPIAKGQFFSPSHID